MSSITFQAIALVILSAVNVTHAPAQQVKAGDLVLDHAWARATPSGAKVGGGFLTIENKGAAPDKLMGASSPAAGKIEVHETAMNNDVATMRPVKGG
ncbi:MAG: copper chaperone PCu(A)C, partial [Pseudolabrys sp.]